MSRLPIQLRLIAVFGAIILCCEAQTALETAKTIDKQILSLHDLTDDMRPAAIKTLSSRIRAQPVKYAVPLATNLAIDGSEGSGFSALQVIADTLTETLQKLPPNKTDQADGFEMLAELMRYERVYTSLRDRRLDAAVNKIDIVDRKRRSADFTLTDLDGKIWSLRRLRGHVVLISFWATWCPPCRRELPELKAIYDHFHSRGLVILAISDEESATLRHFRSRNPISYPLLLDPGDKARKQFVVRGIPQTFVYNREGSLIAEPIARPTLKGFRDILARAGIQN